MSNLGVFLEHENPRVMSFLISLGDKDVGTKVQGFRLCDGNILFQDWRYLGKAKGLKQGQHLFLFREGKAFRAVAWVDQTAKPLLIPTCPKHLDCAAEGQYAISYDVHTFTHYSVRRRANYPLLPIA
jgi:hypothetical protein